MLTHLHIRQFTIIESLDLELQPGMTVLTGETGAGKSILIDAITIALGARVEANLVRNGAARAEVIIQFDIANQPAIQAWFSTHELDATECLIRRTITADGRARSYLNGQPITLQMLKTLAEKLITIHSQHEHHHLLKAEVQRQWLDQYGQHTEVATQLKSIYQTWQTTQAKLAQLCDKNHQDRQAFLKFQLTEWENLQFTFESLQALEQEQQLLSQSTQLIETLQLINLRIAEEENNCLLALHRSLSQLQQLKINQPELDSIKNLIQSAHIQLSEAATQLNGYQSKLEQNPERLTEVEARLQQIYDLARKHRATPVELIHLMSKLQTELASFTDSDIALAELTTQAQVLAQNYQQMARQLTNLRQQAANKLALAITAKLPELGMPQGQFSIQLEPLLEPTAHGMERITFMVKPNPGQAAQPLAKIASGGELSRISLALAVLSAEVSNTPTMIFDEVDTGISGKTAAVVGQLLQQLSRSTQVLCITHQPQVAAFGHTHLQVQKHTSITDTHTELSTLTANLRIDEIARMLGGLSITAQTRAHATELLHLSEQQYA